MACSQNKRLAQIEALIKIRLPRRPDPHLIKLQPHLEQSLHHGDRLFAPHFHIYTVTGKESSSSNKAVENYKEDTYGALIESSQVGEWLLTVLTNYNGCNQSLNGLSNTLCIND